MNDQDATKLLREIRDLLANREQAYQEYLAEARQQYTEHAEEIKKSRQMGGAQAAVLSAWLCLVVFAANVAAGLLIKSLTFFEAVQVNG